MTIEYKDSKRIVALSTDVLETLTFEDDFSSYSDQTAFDNAWVSLDTAKNRGNPTNDNLDVVLKTDNSDDTMVHDLGSSLSDSAWVCRFKWNITGLTRNNTSAWHGWIGLSSTNQTGEFDDSQDSMGLAILTQNTGGNTMFWYASGSSAGAVNEQSSQFDDDVPTGTYYIEMIRNADVITVNVYTDSNYTTLFDGGSDTITGTVTGLQYFKVANKTGNYSGTITSTIDDLKIYNGVTSLTSKPTDVQDNSLLVEKNTARRYWFTANPLLDDNFSTDNFTHADTKTSVSNDKFNWEIELDNSDDTAYRSLGFTLDNSSWVMRFKINFATLATAGNPGAFGKFVLSSTNAGQSGTFDWIGFERYVSSASNTWNLGYGENTSANTASDTFTTTPAASSTYYMELIRDGATITGKMFTGSDYSTGLVDTTTLSMSGTIENLSFFKFYNRSDNTNTSQTATGTLEDLKVWNGVTTASGGGTWTMQTTLEYDLSTSAGWTTTGSNCSVNTSGQYLQGSSSTNDDRATKALGLTLSDTKFVVRQKMELTTVTSGGNGQLYFGYTDKDNSTTVLGNRDGIGITIRSSPDFLQSYALNQAWQSSATLTTTPTATTYYLELIRNSTTSYTLNLYSDSNYSVLVETKTNSISSSVNGLNHITIGGWDNNASGVITARFSNIEIYNGVNTVN